MRNPTKSQTVTTFCHAIKMEPEEGLRSIHSKDGTMYVTYVIRALGSTLNLGLATQT